MNNKSVKGTYSTMLPGFPYLHIFMYISVSVPLLVSCPPFTLPPIFFQVCFSFSFQGISEGVSITWRHATLCTRTHTHKPIIFLIPLDKTLQLWKDYEDITHSKLVEKVPLCHSSKRESCCGDLARCLAKHAEVSQACPAVVHFHTDTHTTGQLESSRRYTNSISGSITKWEHTSIWSFLSFSLFSTSNVKVFSG